MTIKNTYGEEFNIIPSSYDENKNTYKLNSVFAAGMCYSDETVKCLWNGRPFHIGKLVGNQVIE